MKNILKILVIILLFSYLASCSYVSSVVSGTFNISQVHNFYVKWKDGEANKCYPFGDEIVHNAVKHVVKDMGLTVSKEEKNKKGEYYIVAENNDRFKMTIEPLKKNVTRLKIRINFMGDKPYAEIMYKKVDEELNFITFDTNGKPMQVH